jgi:hypothetical protein
MVQHAILCLSFLLHYARSKAMVVHTSYPRRDQNANFIMDSQHDKSIAKHDKTTLATNWRGWHNFSKLMLSSISLFSPQNG